MPINLQQSIGQITTQLQPILDAFLKALGIRTEREQKRTLQKAQQMGRVTTGFLPEMQREVREEAGMQEAQYRGGHAQNIMQLAMQLFGVESEWERFRRELEWKAQQSELDRALERELAKLGRGGEGGFTFPGIGGVGGGGIDDFFGGKSAPAQDIPYGKFSRVGIYRPVVPKKAYQPTQKATTYRGTRLGRI